MKQATILALLFVAGCGLSFDFRKPSGSANPGDGAVSDSATDAATVDAVADAAVDDAATTDGQGPDVMRLQCPAGDPNFDFDGDLLPNPPMGTPRADGRDPWPLACNPRIDFLHDGTMPSAAFEFVNLPNLPQIDLQAGSTIIYSSRMRNEAVMELAVDPDLNEEGEVALKSPSSGVACILRTDSGTLSLDVDAGGGSVATMPLASLDPTWYLQIVKRASGLHCRAVQYSDSDGWHAQELDSGRDLPLGGRVEIYSLGPGVHPVTHIAVHEAPIP